MFERLVSTLTAVTILGTGLFLAPVARGQGSSSAAAPSATLTAFTIDGATRARVIDSAIADLNEYYVFPDVAKRMEAALRAHQNRGDYDGLTDGETFADSLTANLQAVSHDKHLRVSFSPDRVPDGPPGPDPGGAAAYRKRMESLNCGFDRVERLPGNIGYLQFDAFPDPDVCGPTAVAAMNFLANVEALIIDLRSNGGGDPRMVALISTYLFAEPTHLNDLWERRTNTTQQYWTLPYVPGKRLIDQPVYVLTSSRTFSGAEEFTYNLKNLKRATIIGEVTGGGAHPVMGHRIDDHFMIGVPFARAINPITKTNWEGVGVTPDIKVPAADALSTGRKDRRREDHVEVTPRHRWRSRCDSVRPAGPNGSENRRDGPSTCTGRIVLCGTGTTRRVALAPITPVAPENAPGDTERDGAEGRLLQSVGGRNPRPRRASCRAGS